jgi:AraC-like DNA-binding protein
VALGGPVAADVSAWRLGDLVLYERRLAGIGVERRAPRVRRSQFDHFTLQLNLAGELHGEGAQGFQAAQPGEILLLDMAKPMRARMPDTHLITVAVPRAAIESTGASTGALHGLVMPAAPAAALARRLRSFIERAANAPDADFPPAGEALTRLLGATLTEMGLATPAAGARSDDERLSAAQDFIQAHLFDEALSPSRVAHAAKISRATLYRLFDEAGGVRKYIQTQRLAQLRDSLSDPSRRQSVAALAFDAGFASEHHASRSFREAFGLPPAEFRREMQLSAQSRFGDQASALKRTLLDWYSHLTR